MTSGRNQRRSEVEPRRGGERRARRGDVPGSAPGKVLAPPSLHGDVGTPHGAEHRTQEADALAHGLHERNAKVVSQKREGEPRRPGPGAYVHEARPRRNLCRKDDRVGEHQVDELVVRSGRRQIDARVPFLQALQPCMNARARARRECPAKLGCHAVAEGHQLGRHHS